MRNSNLRMADLFNRHHLLSDDHHKRFRTSLMAATVIARIKEMMSVISKKRVTCPVCSGGVRSWIGFSGRLKCSLCYGALKVPPEVDAAYWMLHDATKSPRRTGQLVRAMMSGDDASMEDAKSAGTPHEEIICHEIHWYAGR